MSVQPYTSPEAPPFDPNAGGGGNVAIPANPPVPDLAMVWGTAPSYQPSGAGSPNPNAPAPPASGDFSIDLGSLRDGENQMLSASSAVVDAYGNLKQLFERVKDTVFGQSAQVTQQVITGGASGAGWTSWSPQTTPDPIQQAAQAFAYGQNGQPGMNDVQAYALQQIGNAMALVGEFIALMNASGVSYAQADDNSALPPATQSG